MGHKMRSTRHYRTPQFMLSICLLSLAMVFGGGQGTLGDTLTQLTAVALLVLLYRQNPNLRTWPKSCVYVVVPVVSVLLFMLPLPTFLTNLGIVRNDLSQSLRPVIGDLSSQLSFSFVAAERALFWMLPGIAMYLSALQFTKQQKKLAIAALLTWIFVGAILGLAQKAGGLDSALYFYANTNYGSAVGFFANSNHYAISMAASLPLIWAGLTVLFNQRSKKPVNPLWFVVCSAMAVLFILGFMLSGSRAGLVLGIFGCLLMLPAVILADEHKGAKHWLFAGMAIGLFFTVQIALYFISLKFEANPLDDLRWQLFPITAQAASQFAPWGSGPGSFWFVFPQYDNFLTGDVIANHAHNDYIELWLEMRWLFVLPALFALAAFLWQGIHVWFRASEYQEESTLLARSAWIGILLLLLHSAVDYPLRTTALSTMLALLAAFLVAVESKQKLVE